MISGSKVTLQIKIPCREKRYNLNILNSFYIYISNYS